MEKRVGGHAPWFRAVSSILVGAMTLLPCGSWGVVSASPSSSDRAAVVTVTSDPPTAEVFVDGRQAGLTPLDVRGLAPGEHRVTIKKAGHLDNSRLVTVADARVALAVRLTPTSATPHILRQVEEPGEQPPAEVKGGGGGGGKKIALIAVGLAAVGGGAFLVLKGKNNPPVGGSVAVSPSGTGLAGATSFTFTLQGASDPDGDALKYTWDFGDGGTSSEMSPTHVYGRSGTFTVSATVSDGKLSAAAASATVRVGDLTGRWRMTPYNAYPWVDEYLTIQQNGVNLSGTAELGGALTGTVSASREVNISFQDSTPHTVTLRGVVDPNLTTIPVTFTHLGSTGSCTLQRQ